MYNVNDSYFFDGIHMFDNACLDVFNQQCRKYALRISSSGMQNGTGVGYMPTYTYTY